MLAHFHWHKLQHSVQPCTHVQRLKLRVSKLVQRPLLVHVRHLCLQASLRGIGRVLRALALEF
jgi:hypothetical protein